MTTVYKNMRWYHQPLMKCISTLFLASVNISGLTTSRLRSRLLDFNLRPWIFPESVLTKTAHSPKTAILCHGCHLQCEDWERIVWGDIADQKLGRLSHASLLAIQEKAAILIVGSGGSHTAEGQTEGEFTLQFFKNNLPSLNKFKTIRDHLADQSLNSSHVVHLMERIVVCETESVNTVQEIEHACAFLAKSGVERVILVSSPTHIARCIRDACVVFDKMNYRPVLLASPSDTCYAGSSASDLCVVEPGHRGDRDKRFDGHLGYHKLFPRAMKIDPQKRYDFSKELDKLINKYENGR